MELGMCNLWWSFKTEKKHTHLQTSSQGHRNYHQYHQNSSNMQVFSGLQETRYIYNFPGYYNEPFQGRSYWCDLICIWITSLQGYCMVLTSCVCRRLRCGHIYQCSENFHWQNSFISIGNLAVVNFAWGRKISLSRFRGWFKLVMWIHHIESCFAWKGIHAS